jgi:gliding motility-associated-like protein
MIVDCNEPPLIIGENLVVNEDELLTGNILINGDNDPEGTNLIITTIAINGPSNGIFLIESNGDFSYTPSNNFNGLDTILIQICDEGIPTPACGIDTLIISVLPINDSPSVNNELILLLINTNFSGNLLDNDFDIESTSLIASALISNASNGSFTFNPDGSFTYTPNTSFIGFDTVVVSVCDNGFPLPALCSNDTLIFEVTVFPFSVSAGNDTTICGTETQLNASNLELNATGQWSILNGSATIIEINNPNSLITSLNIGLNELIWTVNLNGFIISDTVSITSLENPNQSFAGNDTLICGAQLNLNANQAIVGIGNWTDISGIAVFENENDEQTLVNNLAPGIYTFIWTIQNNDCATRDTLEVSARSIVSVFAGVDTTICPLNNNIEISISITGANSWNWTTISGSGQISSLTSLTPQFSGLGSDENIFLLSAGLIECADLDTLTIQVLPSDNPLCQQNLIFIPDGFSPNGDSSHDLFVIENLNGLNANVHIYNRYGSLVYESRNYQNDWNGTANAGLVLYGEELPEGTYYYIISIEGETENRLNFITLWR